MSPAEDRIILQAINVIVAILSLGGSLWMCYFCVKSSSFSSASMKIIFSLGIADFLYSVANLMSMFEGPTIDTYCRTEGFIRTFSLIFSVYWATCTSILCSKTLKHGRSFDQTAFYRKALVLGILISLFYALSPHWTRHIAYDKGSLFCWVSFNPNETSMMIQLSVRIFEEVLPMTGGFLISLYFYIQAIKSMRKLSQGFLTSMDLNIYRLLWYPIVMFLTFIPSMADNVVHIITNEPSPFIIQALHEGITHIIGLSNAVVYGLQRKQYDEAYQEKSMECDSYETEIEVETSLTDSLIKAHM